MYKIDANTTMHLFTIMHKPFMHYSLSNNFYVRTGDGEERRHTRTDWRLF